MEKNTNRNNYQDVALNDAEIRRIGEVAISIDTSLKSSRLQQIIAVYDELRKEQPTIFLKMKSFALLKLQEELNIGDYNNLLERSITAKTRMRMFSMLDAQIGIVALRELQTIFMETAVIDCYQEEKASQLN